MAGWGASEMETEFRLVVSLLSICFFVTRVRIVREGEGETACRLLGEVVE